MESEDGMPESHPPSLGTAGYAFGGIVPPLVGLGDDVYNRNNVHPFLGSGIRVHQAGDQRKEFMDLPPFL